MVLLIKMKYSLRWYPSHTHPIPVWLIFNSNLPFVCLVFTSFISHILFLLCYYWQYFSEILLRNEKILFWNFSIDDAKINFSLSNKNNNFEGSFLISRKFLQKNLLFMELSHAKDFLSLSLPLSFILIQVGRWDLSEERWNNSIRYNGNSSRMRLEAERWEEDIKRWDKIWSRVEVLMANLRYKL